jgi:hypothetical protein
MPLLPGAVRMLMMPLLPRDKWHMWMLLLMVLLLPLLPSTMRMVLVPLLPRAVRKLLLMRMLLPLLPSTVRMLMMPLRPGLTRMHKIHLPLYESLLAYAQQGFEVCTHAKFNSAWVRKAILRY